MIPLNYEKDKNNLIFNQKRKEKKFYDDFRKKANFSSPTQSLSMNNLFLFKLK